MGWPIYPVRAWHEEILVVGAVAAVAPDPVLESSSTPIDKHATPIDVDLMAERQGKLPSAAAQLNHRFINL